MKKAFSLLLALILCLTAACALCEDTPATYATIALEMVEPEGFEAAGLYPVFDSTQMNILYVDQSVQLPLVFVLRLSDADYEAIQQDAATFDMMVQDGMTTLGQMDGHIYVMFSATDAPSLAAFFGNVVGLDYETVPANTKEGIENALPLLQQALKTLRPIPQAQAMNGVFSFGGTAVDGSDIPADFYTEKDVTVINVWATYCGPCIQEMPALAQWHASLPDNVQIIGIISDMMEGQDAGTAKAILEQNGVQFTNLLVNESMYTLLSMCSYVPTTFIVDRNGQLIGDPIIGADVQGYIDAVNAYLNP